MSLATCSSQLRRLLCPMSQSLVYIYNIIETRNLVGAGRTSSFLKPFCFVEASSVQSLSEGHLRLLRNFLLEWLQGSAGGDTQRD